MLEIEQRSPHEIEERTDVNGLVHLKADPADSEVWEVGVKMASGGDGSSARGGRARAHGGGGGGMPLPGPKRRRLTYSNEPAYIGYH